MALLGLQSLAPRRINADLVYVYKIVFNLVDTDSDKFFSMTGNLLASLLANCAVTQNKTKQYNHVAQRRATRKEKCSSMLVPKVLTQKNDKHKVYKTQKRMNTNDKWNKRSCL